MSTALQVACGLLCRCVFRSLAAYTDGLKKVVDDVGTLFPTIDTNHDGKVEKSEFSTNFEALSQKMGQDAATVCSIWRAYAHAKKAYEHHKKQAAEKDAPSREDILHKLFGVLDSDNSNAIDERELEQGLEKIATGAEHVEHLHEFSGEADSRNLLARCSGSVGIWGVWRKSGSWICFARSTLSNR